MPDAANPRPPSHAPTSDPGALEQSALLPEPVRLSALSADGRLTGGRLAGLAMPAAIFTLTWPILAESLLNSLVGLTDTVLSAAIDDNGASTDAVGGAVTLLWFVQLVVQAIGVGATAMISRAVGARKVGAANAALGQTLLLALAGGTMVGLVMAAIAEPAATAMSLSPVAHAGFVSYIRLNAIGVPFGSILFAGIACARGAGDSFRPLVAMSLVNVVNVGVSWLLSGVDLRSAAIVNGEQVTRWVIYNPSNFSMGVNGIALGTCAAYVVGCLVMVFMLVQGVAGPHGIRLRAARLRPHWHTLRRLVRLGVPNFLETLGMWAGNLFIILMVGRMGAASAGTLGSHLIAIRVEAFSYLPGFAFASAAATLVGQYLGAGSPALARRAVNICAVCAGAFMAAMGVLFIFAPAALVGLMSAQDVHLEMTPPLLRIAGFVQIPFAMSIVYRSALRGAGDVRATMWLTWLTTYLLRLPLAYLFSGVTLSLWGTIIENPSPWRWGLRGVWYGLCGELVIRGIVFWARFMRGKWVNAKV